MLLILIQVCLWEIWTMGDRPYKEFPPNELMAVIMNGTLRPSIPDGCHPDWVQLMQVNRWFLNHILRLTLSFMSSRFSPAWTLLCLTLFFDKRHEVQGNDLHDTSMPSVVWVLKTCPTLCCL